MYTYLIRFAPGPEPHYEQLNSGYQLFHHDQVFKLRYGILPKIQVAYETWGTLNQQKNNAVLIQTGLSGSSHAKSSDVSNVLFNHRNG